MDNKTETQFTSHDYQLVREIIALYKKEVAIEEQSITDFQLYVVEKIYNQFLRV